MVLRDEGHVGTDAGGIVHRKTTTDAELTDIHSNNQPWVRPSPVAHSKRHVHVSTAERLQAGI